LLEERLANPMQDESDYAQSQKGSKNDLTNSVRGKYFPQSDCDQNGKNDCDSVGHDAQEQHEDDVVGHKGDDGFQDTHGLHSLHMIFIK